MADDLAPRISSLLADLGPRPQQNIHAIVSKTCELLSCDGAVYACFEAGSGTLCIRSACNLPLHPLPARSPIRGFFKEVIANGGAGPVCALNPADRKNKSGASAGPWLGFKSFIGQQVQVGDLPPGALAALDMRRRDFTDPERLLIGLAARALALEEGRLQREQALERRILFEKTLKDMSTMAITVDDTLPFVRRCLEMAATLLATGGAFLWVVNTVNPPSGPDAGQATAHWCEIDTTILSSLSLIQQGNIGGEDIAPGTHTFYPSIAVDAFGNVGIGFAASAPTIFPGAYYTGRKTTDPAGTVQPSITLAAGLAYYVRFFDGTRNRWGDYSGISVDPADDATFWVFNEYARTRGTIINSEDGRWGTRFGKFSFAACEGDLSGNDNDVDDSDLAALIGNPALLPLTIFAEDFGRTSCP